MHKTVFHLYSAESLLLTNITININILKCGKENYKLCGNKQEIRIYLNPIKARGSEFMYSLGGVWRPPPGKKTLENRYRVEMHVHSQFFKASS